MRFSTEHCRENIYKSGSNLLSLLNRRLTQRRGEVKMHLKVFNEREQTTAEIEFSGKTVIELLDHLHLNPETVIVSRGCEVLTEKETLNENDSIELISVISGAKMSCGKCDSRAVIALQHGGFCKKHFINYFEDKVFKTINRFQLLGRNEKICVAASGGKDSLTVLYLTKKYLEKNGLPTNNLFALAIDEGIDNYREKTLIDLKKFCLGHSIPLQVVSFQEELGKTLDYAYPLINRDANKKPCNVCGVWRRYLLNRYARKLGADKLVTGHNLDDEAQYSDEPL